MLQSLSDFLYVEWLGDLVIAWSWLWPIAEMLHFLGLAVLIGVTGLFDLRMLGVAKGVPPSALHRLMPWALAGFAARSTTWQRGIALCPSAHPRSCHGAAST